MGLKQLPWILTSVNTISAATSWGKTLLSFSEGLNWSYFYSFQFVNVKAMVTATTVLNSIQKKITVWINRRVMGTVSETDWSSRLQAFVSPIQADSQNCGSTRLCLRWHFWGCLKVAADSCRREKVDRMMILSPSVLNKYRWYSV